MKQFVLLFTLSGLLLLTACDGEKAPSAAPAVVDTVATQVADTIADDTEEPPATADGLFDDFMYSFMSNSKFQRERTVFPLPHVVDGRQTTISAADWKHDRLYARYEMYTMLFDNATSMKNEQNPDLTHTAVERIDLSRMRVKAYTFDKKNGQWKLTAINEHSLQNNTNADFYTFYRRFATRADYRREHISNPFEYKTYDADAFQEIEGVLDVVQWDDFAPVLPDGVIININYEQPYTDSAHRVMVITSPSAGLSSTLHFTKERGQWMLTRLESN